MENQIEELVSEILNGSESVGKSGLKLLTVCAMLSGLEWDNVSKFALKWEAIKAVTGSSQQIIPVPIVMIVMKNGSDKIIMPDDDEIIK